MKEILFIALFTLTQIHAAIPSRLNGKKIELAVGDVNGKIYFDSRLMQDEMNAQLAFSTAVVSVINYAPTPLELMLSSGTLKYENNSDYLNSVNDKGYLEDKLDDVKPSEARKKSSQIQELKSENNKR